MSTSRTQEDWMVLRRLAVELLQDGKTQEHVAGRLQVSRSSIKRWKKAFAEGGIAALAPRPRQPRARRLSDEQCERLCDIITAGPLAAGFDTDLWTCRRMAEVVRRAFSVSYHPDHLGRILHALGFTPQKPQRRARQRDEQAILRWREKDWPRIKKGDAAAKLASSFLTKLASCCNP
jgi:transposase